MGWGPPIRGFKSSWEVLRTGETNRAIFLPKKPSQLIYLIPKNWRIASMFPVPKRPFLMGFFSYAHLGERSFGGATKRNAVTAPLDELFLLGQRPIRVQ